jgi:osmotically inducible protein OsmC
MALSLMLGEAGYTADSIDTTADVSLDKTDGGFAHCPEKQGDRSRHRPQQFDGIIQKAKRAARSRSS